MWYNNSCVHKQYKIVKKNFSIIIIIINNLRYECSFYWYVIFLSPVEKKLRQREPLRHGAELQERRASAIERSRIDDCGGLTVWRIRILYDTGRVVRPGGYVLAAAAAAVPVRERVSSLPPGVGTVRPSPPGTRWHTPPIAR